MVKDRESIAELSFQFAKAVIKFYKQLIERKKEYVLSKQLLRSGTAIGALVREAQNAESKADFIHKLAIAQKECGESQYWLELLKDTGYIDNNRFAQLYPQSKSLMNMIRSAIITTKQNLSKAKKPTTPNP